MTARPRQTMPAVAARALDQHKLRDAYEARPPYQRNDYLLWISAAKREDARDRRLEQMLGELRDGTHYMNMPWHPQRTSTGG